MNATTQTTEMTMSVTYDNKGVYDKEGLTMDYFASTEEIEDYIAEEVFNAMNEKLHDMCKDRSGAYTEEDCVNMWERILDVEAYYKDRQRRREVRTNGGKETRP